MQPLKRHKNLKDEDGSISKLSDDILSNILSLLSLKDAAITSVLGQRWRYLWTFTTNLNFDGYEIVKRTPAYSKQHDKERAKFIKMVNSVVGQHRGSYVDQFVVNFDFNSTFSSTIDAWVKFAMKKHLQAFQLQLCGFRSDTHLPRYVLDQQVFFDSSREDNNIAFKSLKVLRFRSVDVSDSVIHYLLSNCSLLEQLEVYDSLKVVKLSVVGPKLALKHLELRRCRNIQSIEICDAVNLVSFHCKIEPEVRLVVRNVPMLVDVYLSFRKDHVDLAFNLLSCCLSQLQILQLDVSLQVYMAKREYPVLPNIKQLNLMLARYDEYNLIKLIPFIEAFPYLQKLVLTIFFRSSPRKESAIMEPPTKCSHGYLKEVEVLGYSGSTSDVQIITYLIENAVALEKINIKSFIFEEDLHLVFYQSVKDKDNARDHGIEQLKEMIPSTIEFICP